ncbi:hypothetical protein LOTGIDRAFT_107610 [Lottia gigantea]|uniref:Cornichon n=1 Tax=Lottia gigantea TaxID=225164 RepID=V3Z4K4_LOTGI|nr:hypothetical protein LOTGIDRAFT_107610 [Lottia gigantea]ESO85618.1 hypothetical protein LOTGIDRAFT_107610 [Lottia gigantea]
MAFTFAAFCYIVALILTAVLIFFAIFHIIAFDELKTDYKNPIDQCSSLNPVSETYYIYYMLSLIFFVFQLVLPEYFIHMLFTFLFLCSFQFGSLLFNLPLAVYHVHRYMTRPVMSSPGLYDPTSIMNADQLNRAQKEGWIKLAFYLLSFFYYLYSMIYVLVSSS